MPEGYMPILEAASMLAFGDPEFLNYTLEKKFDPQIGRELLIPKESCPEIDRELDRLIGTHTAGDLIIIGRRRAMPEWRNQVRHPDPEKVEIRNRYDAISFDYFRFNDGRLDRLIPSVLSLEEVTLLGRSGFTPL